MPEVLNAMPLPLDENTIISQLRAKLNSSNAYSESEISEQRKLAYHSYYGSWPEPPDEGSQLVSYDVLDAVEGAKAVIMEAFTSGREIVSFEPKDENDVDAALMADCYVRKVFERGQGHAFLQDSLHDGLVAKNSVAKYWWREDFKDQEEEYGPFNAIQRAQLLQQPNVSEIEVQETYIEDPMGNLMPMYSGIIVRRTDTSRVEFRVCKPESFYGDYDAADYQDFTFAADREVVPRGEIVEAYPHMEREIMTASTFNEEWEDTENLARHANDRTNVYHQGGEIRPERERVSLYDCYWKLTPEGSDTFELWRFVICGDAIMEAERVDDIPYIVWSPFPLSHRWDGMSMADVMTEIQRSNTTLKRSIIDYQVRTNNPQKVANVDFLRNPRDLVDNSIGSVIDTDAPDITRAVVPLQQPQMSPTVFSAIEMLNQEKEARSSYTRLAGGVNQDAISKQNAGDMIAELTGSGNRRLLMMARHFAEVYVVPLFLAIYNLGRENDQNTYDLKVNGQWQKVSPMQMPERSDMSVDTAMTPDAGQQRALSLLSVHQVLMQDPEAGLLYPMTHRYNLYADVLRDLGETAVDQYVLDPQSPQGQQAVQGMQQQQQMMQQMQQMQADFQQQLAGMALQIERMKAETDAQYKADQIIIEEEKVRNEAQYKADDMGLKEDQQEHQEDVDEAKLKIEARKVANG